MLGWSKASFEKEIIQFFLIGFFGRLAVIFLKYYLYIKLRNTPIFCRGSLFYFNNIINNTLINIPYV